MKFHKIFCSSVWLSILVPCLQLPAGAIIIQLDYTYDTGNYFGAGSAERERLEDAAEFFEDLLIDDLDAITPTASYAPFPLPESWQVNFTNPSTGLEQTVNDLVVAEDTIIVYVGARDLEGSALAEGGFGGSTGFSIPNSEFDQAMKTRGESGFGTTDFAPWGGFISIDDTVTWDTSLAGNGTDQHLYSTLLHEVAHVLGFGTADSWNAQISGGEFIGTEAVAEFGGNVPLYLNTAGTPPTYDHLLAGSMSTIWGTNIAQEASLDPDINPGEVKLFTHLDVAVLDDIGWDIAEIPEPVGPALLAIGLLPLLRRRRTTG